MREILKDHLKRLQRPGRDWTPLDREEFQAVSGRLWQLELIDRVLQLMCFLSGQTELRATLSTSRLAATCRLRQDDCELTRIEVQKVLRSACTFQFGHVQLRRTGWRPDHASHGAAVHSVKWANEDQVTLQISEILPTAAGLLQFLA